MASADDFLYTITGRSVAYAMSLFDSASSHQKTKMANSKTRTQKSHYPLHLLAKRNNFQYTYSVALYTSPTLDSPSQLNLLKDTPLHIAVKRGNVLSVKALLLATSNASNSAVSPNSSMTSVQNYKGRTPFHIAAKNGNIEIFKLLVGSSPSSSFASFLLEDCKKKTVHHYILKKGILKMMMYVAKYMPDDDVSPGLQLAPPKNPSKNSRKYISYLHRAVRMQNHRLLEILLSRGADPNPYVKFEEERKDLMRKDCTSFDLARKERDKIPTQSPLIDAIYIGDEIAVSMLLRYGADPCIAYDSLGFKRPLIRTAIDCGSMHITRMLIAMESRVQAGDLACAMAYGRYNLTLLVLSEISPVELEENNECMVNNALYPKDIHTKWRMITTLSSFGAFGLNMKFDSSSIRPERIPSLFDKLYLHYLLEKEREETSEMRSTLLWH